LPNPLASLCDRAKIRQDDKLLDRSTRRASELSAAPATVASRYR
jgi:hypothetical protein